MPRVHMEMGVLSSTPLPPCELFFPIRCMWRSINGIERRRLRELRNLRIRVQQVTIATIATTTTRNELHMIVVVIRC